jgi:PhnB protein
MKVANPYLNFEGYTEEAFRFYRSVFGGEFLDLRRFRDFPDNPMGIAEHELDKIAHIALSLGSNILMGTDVVESMPTRVTIGNNFYITIEPESADEADSLFNALADGGVIEMPLMRTEWAEKYGICADRYGIQWMISYGGVVNDSQPS